MRMIFALDVLRQKGLEGWTIANYATAILLKDMSIPKKNLKDKEKISIYGTRSTKICRFQIIGGQKRRRSDSMMCGMAISSLTTRRGSGREQ